MREGSGHVWYDAESAGTVKSPRQAWVTSHGAGRRLTAHEKVRVGVEFGVEEGGMWESGRSAQGIFKHGVGIVVHEKTGAA